VRPLVPGGWPLPGVTFGPIAKHGPEARLGVVTLMFDRNGLEILGRDECLELLESCPVGRVALTAHALPVVVPVNHRLLGEDLVFATGVGSKLLAMAKGTVVGFEVDDFDPATRSGWSVLVVGMARRIVEGDDDWAAAQTLDLAPWVGHHAKYFVRLPTGRISGRRLVGTAAEGLSRSR